MIEEIVVRNSAICLRCGDEIISERRHAFRTCSCGALSVDGGLDYRRRVYTDDVNWLDTSILAEPAATRDDLREAADIRHLCVDPGYRPKPEVITAAPLLDEWRVVPARIPPAADGMRELVGNVSGHPDFANGQRIRTTPLLFDNKSESYARTFSRFFRLGRPARETLQ